MKKVLVSLVALLYSFMALAQFEGTILWDTKLEIIDQKPKAGLAQSSEDEALDNKAQMLALQAQMSDPAFKKMLESNPEMMKMLNNQLAQGNAGASML